MNTFTTTTGFNDDSTEYYIEVSDETTRIELILTEIGENSWDLFLTVNDMDDCQWNVSYSMLRRFVEEWPKIKEVFKGKTIVAEPQERWQIYRLYKMGFNYSQRSKLFELKL